MKRNDRQIGDPHYIGPTGKSRSQRKGGRDGGLTPTERVKKERLMRQFQALPEGSSGNSAAYIGAACWDENGKLKP